MRRIAILSLVCLATAAQAAEYAQDFDKPLDPAEWTLHGAGKATARVDDGTLRLDMSSLTPGKHAWADLRLAIQAPCTIVWDQQLARDSAHCYTTGIALRDPLGGCVPLGLTGQPMNHVVNLPRGRTDTPLTPGEWYRFTLVIPAARKATLTVVNRRTGRVVVRTPAPLYHLNGTTWWLSFYHNQPRNEPPDAFDQDRGISRFDNLRITAASIRGAEMATYRDAKLRAMDTRTPMTFNRATTWLPLPHTVLAYDRAATLHLTGTQQAASWQANRLCTVESKDATSTTFARPNDLDGADHAAIRSLQWCIRQHPILEYDLTPHAGACSLKITLVCPYLGDGIEVLRTTPTAKPQHGTLDLAKVYRERGLDTHQFAEIGVFVAQHRPPDKAAKQGTADISLKLTGPGALVTTPPVVRTADRASEGVRIHAVLAGANGQPDPKATATAHLGHRSVRMTATGQTGVLAATLTGLDVGTHTVRLLARDAAGHTFENTLRVTITDGDFATWSPKHTAYRLRSGRVLPTLLGDLYAWVPMFDAASVNRRVIPSHAEWQKLTPEQQANVRLMKLRTLNRAEIRTQLESYAARGVRVIRLVPNVSPHEAYLDAGGHVSMHGLESLLLVLDECRLLGLRAVINVFHYPYWSSGTGHYPPWQQYIDAGYRDQGAFTGDTMAPMLRRYLAELLACLRDDPAVLAYSLTGENDQSHGAPWINAMFDYVRTCDPNHPITQEQGGGPQSGGGVPWGYDAFKPTKSAGLGFRTYYTDGSPSDAYMMACARFYRATPPAFTAEVCSGPGWHGGFVRNWTHPDFITKWRDTCWAALLGQQTMAVAWAAPWAMDECRVPQMCAEQIDWTAFRRITPAVALLAPKVDRAAMRRLCQYEAALARLGVDCDYVWPERQPDAARLYPVVLDAREAFVDPVIPAKVLDTLPVTVSDGYSVSFLLSDDRRQMLAYVRNTAEYKLSPGYGHGTKELHRQRTRSSPLTIGLRLFPTGCRYRLYDLDTRRQVREGPCEGHARIDLGETNHDFAIVVTP